jgi:hypothetical protein
MATIWVYKPPHYEYLIAKKSPFSFYSPVMDLQSGQPALKMIQGVPMPLPTAWDWKQKVDGRTFAGFQTAIYDITDLEHTVFISPR